MSTADLDSLPDDLRIFAKELRLMGCRIRPFIGDASICVMLTGREESTILHFDLYKAENGWILKTMDEGPAKRLTLDEAIERAQDYIRDKLP